MRSLALACALSLGACASLPPDLRVASAEGVAVPPISLPHDLRDPVLGLGRGVVLLDTRVLREMRRSEAEQRGLSLMTGQKVALWVGVGVVVTILVGNYLENNVAFFP